MTKQHGRRDKTPEQKKRYSDFINSSARGLIESTAPSIPSLDRTTSSKHEDLEKFKPPQPVKRSSIHKRAWRKVQENPALTITLTVIGGLITGLYLHLNGLYAEQGRELAKQDSDLQHLSDDVKDTKQKYDELFKSSADRDTDIAVLKNQVRNDFDRLNATVDLLRNKAK